MQQLVHPAVGFNTLLTATVMSSIAGPVEVVFGSVEVVPPSIGRAGQHGRKMATLR